MDFCSIIGVLPVIVVVAAVSVALTLAFQRPKIAPSRPRGRLEYCPSCDAGVGPDARACPACGLHLLSPLAARLERVRVAGLEVRRLRDDGDLDEETAGRVAEQLRRRKQSLLNPPDPSPRDARRPVGPPPLPAPDAVAKIDTPPFETAEEAVHLESPTPRPSPRPRPLPSPLPPPLPPRAARPPRRTLAEGFANFLQERNILWGELAGGLLIVGCSIALVLSLWGTLQELPYFTFLLSAGITAAVFGAGYYTFHHWKLAVTSRGLLVIALLLTPLNLLLLGDPGARGSTDVFDAAVKVAAVLAFAWMVRTGGRDLLEPDGASRRWWLALALVGAPASQMAPLAADAGLFVHQPAWLSVGCFALAAAAVVGRLSRRLRKDPAALPADTAAAVLLFLGLAAFGLFAAWGFVLSRADDMPAVLRGLALPTVLAGLPILSAGLLVQRGVAGAAGLRAAGTGVAAAGMVVLFTSLGLAWPDPATLLAAAAAVGLLLGWVAGRDELPWLYVGAIPAAAVAVVLGFHAAAGGWEVPAGASPADWLRGRLTAADSGAALVGFAAVLWGLSEWFARRGRPADTLSLAVGAAGVALVGLLVVTGHGVERPAIAAGAHLACAAGFIAASFRWRYRVVAHFGVWLLAPATLWSLWGLAPGDRGVWGLVVGGEGLALALTALALPRWPRLRNACRDVAGAAGLLSLALPLATGVLSLAIPFVGDFHRDPTTSGILFFFAATALILAALYREYELVWAGSLVGLLALAQLLMFPLGIESWRLALLLAVLIHSTLTLAAATALWAANPRFNSGEAKDGGDAGSRPHRPGLFTDPLRFSSRLTACLAVPLLLLPDSGLAALWAAFAVWAGGLWLAASLVWKDRGAVPAFQAALTWAAGLLGFAWVERQDWFPSPLGLFDPRALHAYGLAVAGLSVGWESARRAFRLRAGGWDLGRPALDRVVLAGLVAGQLLLAAAGLFPFVVAEQTPLGAAPPVYPLAEAVHVWGWGAWALLGTLAAALALEWRRVPPGSPVPVAGFTLLALTVPVLAAGSFAADLAAASALRWGLAVVFLLGSAVAAVLRPVAQEGRNASLTLQSLAYLRGLITAGAAVVLLLTAHVAMLGLAGLSPTGPGAGTVFERIGWTASMTAPLAFIVLGLAGTALRERSAGYAFAGGLVWLGAVAGGYALGVVTGGGPLDAAEQMRVALLAVGAAAVWSLAWLGVERRIPGRGLLTAMIGAGLAGLTALCLIPLSQLMALPARPLGAAAARLGVEGWAAALLAFGAAVWHAKPAWRAHAGGAFALVAGVLAACAAQPWDGLGEWLSFHVLGAAWAAAGIAAAAVALRPRSAPSAVRWPEALAVGLALMSLRAGWHDPWPWAPSALAVVAALVMAAVAVTLRSRGHEYAAGGLAVSAGGLLWVAWGPDSPTSLAMAAAAGLAAAGMAFSLRRPTPAPGSALPPFPHLAAALSLALLLFGLVPTLSGDRIDPTLLAWGALAAVGGACALLWNDPAARFRVSGLYVVGVAAVGLAVAGTRPGPVWLGWPTPLSLAGYALAAAAAVSRFGRPSRLPVLQAVTAALVLGMAVRTAVAEADLAHRLAAPLAAFLLIPVAAWGATNRRGALALGAVALGLTAWAIPDPAGGVPWLNRHAGLFVALTVTAAVYLNVRTALASANDFRRTGGAVGGLALVALAVLLTQQIPQFDPVTRRTPLDLIAVGAVLAAMLGLLALALQCALKPGRDPLGPTAHGRTGYVYLAEVLLVLVFAHVRLNVPEAFTGHAVRYWTFIVMLLAFAGVGLAEAFARRGLRVLSGPLLRTGALLPLLPLLAFWAKPPGAVMAFADERAPGLRPMLGYLEKLPQHFDQYAALWFLAGLLYGLVALSRRSFGWALLGALATNAGLWALLSHNGVPAVVHPQVWAVPLALIVLVSEHVNRRRLRAAVASGMRYAGVSMIYVASAADLFIAGLGQTVWLPVVLAVWCLAGVAAGVMFRVRAFLYLGLGFMALDVFAMIWHAAVDRQQPWVWYASGIALGVVILGLFAVLEKRRNDVRGLMGKLREWD